MKVILTERCCGKSTLGLKNREYIDFDIFFKCNKFSYSLVEEVIKAYIPNCNEDKIYLVNVTEFFRFRMDKMNIKIQDVCLPELTKENIEFRKKLFRERDMKKYNFIRQKEYEDLERKYIEAHQTIKTITDSVILIKKDEFLESYV